MQDLQRQQECSFNVLTLDPREQAPVLVGAVEVKPVGLVNKAVGHHIGESHVRTCYCHPPPFLRLCLPWDERRPHSDYVNMKLAKTDLTIFQSAQGSEPIDIVLATQSSNTDFARMLSQAKTEAIEDSADYEIFRTGDSANGAIALFAKPDQTIDYLVQYHNET
jgi:hypothetical protein